MIQHRTEIDGLRALAVLPIVLYHAGVKALPAGFVGVDIFFVISGFLITSILLHQNVAGKFSLLEFYQRRIRRIIPALAATLAVTLIAGYFILLDDEYKSLAKSTIAALFFIPNIYFYNSIGYFGIDAATTPLLHTWSLGVEEQYYLFFPLIIFFSIRYLKTAGTFYFLLALSLVSFIYNIRLVDDAGDFTFYMLPTRAWELLWGGLLAFPQIKSPKSRPLAELAGIAGLGLIISALFYVTEKMPFPGYNAALPVAGTLLIIWSTSNTTTITKRLFSLRPLVFTGLISYSLYLWHWPITVYLNMLTDSSWLPLIITLAAYALACLSFYLVEQPFRRKDTIFTVPRLMYSAALASIVLVGASLLVIKTAGMSFRIPAEVKHYSRLQNFLHDHRYCHLKSLKQIKNKKFCTFGTDNQAPSFVLLGDSHADALRPALESAAKAQGVAGIQLTTAGCRPLYGIYNNNKARCRKFMQLSADLINSQTSITTIFLAGYWRVSLTGESYRYKNYIIRSESSDSSSIANNPTFFYEGLQNSISAFPGKKIVFVSQPPEIEMNPRKLYARSLFLEQTGLSKSVDVSDRYYSNLKNEILQRFTGKLEFFDLFEILCPNGHCPLFANNHLIYRDGDHLSKYGAELLAHNFESYLK